MDLNIKTKEFALSQQRKTAKKHFNKILNEMREQNQNKLQLPNLEE